jgi:hypothetical protein
MNVESSDCSGVRETEERVWVVVGGWGNRVVTSRPRCSGGLHTAVEVVVVDYGVQVRVRCLFLGSRPRLCIPGNGRLSLLLSASPPPPCLQLLSLLATLQRSFDTHACIAYHRLRSIRSTRTKIPLALPPGPKFTCRFVLCRAVAPRMRGYRMVWQCPGPRTVGWSGLGAVRVRDLPELVAGLALQQRQ